MDSSSGQLSTSPVLKTLNSLNSNEQNSSFNVSLTSYNMEQELLNKKNGQHSSFPVPLLFNNVKQELLNKNNGQHSSFPAPLSFNIIKEEILANDNEEHLWFPVPSTFNHVKQELIINFNEQLPSQTVPGPLTSTSAPGIEVLDSDFITKDILKMGSLPALSEQGKNICQSRESPKQQRTSDSSSNVQPLCDMECTSNESSPYSGLSYKNSLGYISAEDSPPTGQEECYKPPSGKNVSPLSCTVCGKRFTHNRSLYYHMRIHKDPGISCDICGVFLNKSYGLRIHRQIHFDKTPHKCSICLKGFCSTQSLEQHKAIHTPEGVKRDYLCHLCGKLTTRQGFYPHLLIHSKVTNYICDICGKVFKSQSRLKRHLVTHNDKTFTCAKCNISLKGRHHIYTHIRNIHPETMGLTETVMCPKCGKYFRQSRIAVHLYYHNKDKNYHCGVCSKSFMTNAQLNFHMVIHTGEKKYQCDLCGSKFKALWGLTKHKKSSIHNKKST